jgi:hypothetical protein
MASCLTEFDKERCRYHLGYLESSMAPSIQLGIPRPIQTVFLLEQAIQRLIDTELACARVRRILDCLDKIEDQLKSSLCMLGVEKLGDLTLHPLRSKGKLVTDSLEDEYRRWAYRLSDVLGVPTYPYSHRFRRSGPGSNIAVS